MKDLRTKKSSSWILFFPILYIFTLINKIYKKKNTSWLSASPNTRYHYSQQRFRLSICISDWFIILMYKMGKILRNRRFIRELIRCLVVRRESLKQFNSNQNMKNVSFQADWYPSASRRFCILLKIWLYRIEQEYSLTNKRINP